jgi:hypothetical protein
MDEPTNKSDETEDDEIFYAEPSDEALELAAGTVMCTSDTVNSRYACTQNRCCLCR